MLIPAPMPITQGTLIHGRSGISLSKPTPNNVVRIKTVENPLEADLGYISDARATKGVCTLNSPSRI